MAPTWCPATRALRSLPTRLPPPHFPWRSSTTPTAPCSIAVFGDYTSDPSNCQYNGVMAWIDRFNPDATIGHAVMALNGRCAVTPNLVSMMQFQLARAFGKILGLGYSQVSPDALRKGDRDAASAWPIMQPASGGCGPAGGTCIPEPDILHFDDIAALNRMYPITADNLSSLPGQETDCGQYGLHRRNHHVSHRNRHAGSERGGAAARRQRQSAQGVHGDGGFRSILRRQARKRGRRLQRYQRRAIFAMGLNRHGPAGVFRFALSASASGDDSGDLADHV